MRLLKLTVAWLAGILFLTFAVFIGVRLYQVETLGADDFRRAAAEAGQRGDRNTQQLYLKKLLTLEPDDRPAHDTLSKLLIPPNADPTDPASYAENPEALTHFVEAAKGSDDDPLIQRRLMIALNKAGRPEEATVAAARLLQLGEDNDLALRLLTVQALNDNKLDEADLHLKRLKERGFDKSLEHAMLFLRFHIAREDKLATETFLTETIRQLGRGGDSVLRRVTAGSRDSLFALLKIARSVVLERGIDAPILPELMHLLSRLVEAHDDLADTLPYIRMAGRLMAEPRMQAAAMLPDSPQRKLLAQFVSRTSGFRTERIAPPIVYVVASRLAALERDEAKATQLLAAGLKAHNDRLQQSDTSSGYIADAGDSADHARLLIDMAHRAIVLRQVSTATPVIDSLLKDEATQGWGRLFRGVMRMDQGRFADAEADLKAARESLNTSLQIHTALVRLYLQQGRWFDANETLGLLEIDWQSMSDEQRRWVERFLGRADGVQFARITALLGLDELARAQPLIDRLSDGPNAAACQRLLVQFDLHHKRTDAARKRIDSARKQFPTDMSLATLDAALLRQAGKSEAALQVLTNLASEQPTSLIAQITHANAMFHSGKPEKAIARLDAIAESFPKASQPLVLAAGWLLSQSQFDAAATRIAKLNERKLDDQSVRLIKAKWALMKHGGGQVLDELFAEHDNLKHDPTVTAWQAQLLTKQGQSDQAITHLENSWQDERLRLALTPTVTDTLGKLAQENSPQVAMKHVESFLADDPDNALLMMLAMRLSQRLEDHAATLKWLKRLELQVDDRFKFVVMQAITLEKLARADDAVATLERAVKLKPDHLELRLTASRWNLDLGKTDAALAHAVAAQRAAPDKPEPYILAAETLWHRKEHKSSLEWLGPLLKHWPDRIEGYQILADVYVDQPDLAKARATIDFARNKFPDNPGFKRTELRLLLAEKRWDEAGTLAAEQLTSESSFDHILRFARAFGGARAYQQAIAWSRRSLTLASTDAQRIQALDVLARASHFSGLKQKDAVLLEAACNYYERLSELDVKAIKPVNNVAWISSVLLDDQPRALRAVKELLKRLGETDITPSHVDTIVEVYRRSGQVDDARALIERTTKRHPESALIHAQAGLLTAMDPTNASRAKQALERAIALGLPEHRVKEVEAALLRLGN